MCLRVITADSMATFALRNLWLPQISTCMFGLHGNLLRTQSTGLPRGLPRPDETFRYFTGLNLQYKGKPLFHTESVYCDNSDYSMERILGASDVHY